MIDHMQRTLTANAPRQRTSPRREHRRDDSVELLRALAREGRLAETYKTAPSEQRRRLSGAAMALASPVVFSRVTRVVELKRGHSACAVSMARLADNCLDHFYDDLEAVTHDVLHNATKSITNLEGWMARRVRAATVDAHRRRRGAKGALQRPRLPRWISKGLGQDPWLGHLAVEILTWVGVAATAGTSLWPMDGWTDRRAAFAGTRPGDDVLVLEREVEQVLALMRTRPQWYQDFVERPMGSKTPPVVAMQPGRWAEDGPPPLTLIEPHEVLDAQLAEKAADLLEAINNKIMGGGDLAAAVVAELSRVFGSAAVGEEIGGLPHGPSTADERVTAIVDDPAVVANVVQVVADILSVRGAHAQ